MNRKKRNGWVMLALLFILAVAVLVGCGQDSQEPDDGQNHEQPPASAEDVERGEEASFPRTLIDATGEEVTLAGQPETIVSIIPSVTETLFALGLGDRVVGVSGDDNYPEEVLDKEVVTAGMGLNEEVILSLDPDLLLFSSYHYFSFPEAVQQFKDAGIPVVVVNEIATSFDDVYASIQVIAEATGTGEQAELMISQMKQQLQDLEAKAQSIEQKKKVWIEVSPAPELYTTGNDTFMHLMLESIGALNAAGDVEGWPMFSEEEAVQLNPDVIIVLHGNPDDVYAREAWSEVTAVQHEAVYSVNEDLVSRSGPRIMDGVQELAEAIYPQLFEE